jgi:hypothetical protein
MSDEKRKKVLSLLMAGKDGRLEKMLRMRSKA